MHSSEPTPRHAMRAREIVLVALLVTLALFVFGAISLQSTEDVRAVERLAPADRSSFVRGECEALRALCRGLEPVSTCVERAHVLRQLEGLDADCRALTASLGGPRR